MDLTPSKGQAQVLIAGSGTLTFNLMAKPCNSQAKPASRSRPYIPEDFLRDRTKSHNPEPTDQPMALVI